jgi:hypothetical protein
MTRVSRRWLLVAVAALGACAAGTGLSLLF